MDIEGAELLAFLGMERLIKRSKKLIIISEFYPGLLKKCGFSGEEFIKKVLDLGLKLQIINERSNSIEPISANNLMRMCSNNKYVNLYLEKNSVQGDNRA